MSGIIDIGIKSLLANQYALMLTSQNISGANVSGYARREIDFEEIEFYGGVTIGDVKRITDETSSAWARATQSIFSGADKLAGELANLEPLFENDKNGIGTQITDTLATLEKLNTDPSSASNRDLYISGLNELTKRMQSISGSVTSETQKVNQSLQSDVSQINAILQSLLSVNQKLTAAASAGNQDTMALQDSRDALLEQLSSYMNFSTQIDSTTGAVNVAFQNGLQLVSSSTAATLATMNDPENQANLILGMADSSGNVKALDPRLIQSGEVKGWLDYRSTALQPLQRLLDRLSIAFASALNTQNKLGLDGNGNIGSNLFNDINSSAQMSQRAAASSNNTGSGSIAVHIDTVSQLTASQYRLSFDASGNYTLVRQSDGVTVSTGALSGSYPQTISADGFSMQINSGTYHAGDVYTINPTAGGCSNFSLINTDPSTLALAWPVTASATALASGSTGKITVDGMTDTTTSSFSTPGALNPPIQIKFLSSTSYELINANTSAVIEGPITYDPSVGAHVFPTPGHFDPGYRISITGNLQAGDLFDVKYNTDSKGDNRNGLAMAALYKQGVLMNNTTFVDGMTNITGTLATLASQANSSLDAAKSANDSAVKVRDSISGVSMEEENMNLLKYQEAYQASAQILEAAKNVIQIILQIGQR